MLYPDTVSNCSTTPDSTTNKCLKLSGSNVIANYVRDNTITPQGFCLNITNGTLSYKITSTTYNVPVVGDCNPVSVSQTFNYTGSAQTWTVPAGISSVTIECWGAQGGEFYAGINWGGKGGYSKGDLSVSPGNKLSIYVGSFGNQFVSFNGNSIYDGTNNVVGGGASDVRYDGTTIAPTALSARKIVAGGGGGGRNPYQGGYGGGLAGGTGNSIAVANQSSGYSLGEGQHGWGDSYSGGGGGYYGGYRGEEQLTGVDEEGYDTFGTGGAGGGSGYIGGVINGQTIAGNMSFPAPGGGNETGHSGNGVVKIVGTSSIY